MSRSDANKKSDSTYTVLSLICSEIFSRSSPNLFMEFLNISISSSLHLVLKSMFNIQNRKRRIAKYENIYPALAFSEECNCIVNFPKVLKANRNYVVKVWMVKDMTFSTHYLALLHQIYQQLCWQNSFFLSLRISLRQEPFKCTTNDTRTRLLNERWC